MSKYPNRIPRNLPRGDKPEPQGLQRIAVYIFGTAGIATLSVLVVGMFVFTATLAGPALKSAQLAAVISATLVDLTNQDRESKELSGLTVSPLLVQAAQAKANDMAANDYFAHISPSGLNSWYWFKQAGYNFSYAGENLAVDFTDSGDVNQAWLNSPTHRANIMNSHFTQIGIATSQGMFEGHQTTFVVQMFGAPADDTYVSEPVETITSPAVPTEMAVATTKPTTAPLTSEVLGTSVQPPVAQPAVPAPAPVVTAPVSTSTATATPPATVAVQNVPRYAPSWAVLVSFPKELLQMVYLILAGFLIVTLIARTGLEIRRHHIRHVCATAALLVLMLVLFYAAEFYVFVQPDIGTAQQTMGQ